MALADVEKRGGGVGDIIGEIVHDILVGLDGGVALVELVQATPLAEQDVGQGLAFRKLERVGLVGGVCSLEITGSEKLVGVLQVHALEGVQFRESLAGIDDFLTSLILGGKTRAGEQPGAEGG